MFNLVVINDISKIIYDYTVRGIYLDGKALDKIISIFCSAFDLNDEIEKLEYTDFSPISSIHSAYRIGDKKLLFNYGINLSKSVEEVLNSGKFTNNYEKILEVNLSILSKLIKQISKAYYFKGCFEHRRYLDQLMCRASFESYMLKKMPISKDEKCRAYIYLSNFLYANNEKFYNSIPSNRMANVVGLVYANSLSNDKDLNKSKLVREYQQEKYLKGALKGYDFSSCINSPTIGHFTDKAKIMKGLGFETPLYDIGTALCTLDDESDRLDLFDKLYYGLNLNEEEQKKLSKKLN